MTIGQVPLAGTGEPSGQVAGGGGGGGGIQLGGVPVQPAGHVDGVTQFGGVPVWPAGQVDGVTQLGGVPVWPAGQVDGDGRADQLQTQTASWPGYPDDATVDSTVPYADGPLTAATEAVVNASIALRVALFATLPATPTVVSCEARVLEIIFEVAELLTNNPGSSVAICCIALTYDETVPKKLLKNSAPETSPTAVSPTPTISRSHPADEAELSYVA